MNLCLKTQSSQDLCFSAKAATVILFLYKSQLLASEIEGYLHHSELVYFIATRYITIEGRKNMKKGLNIVQIT